MVHGVQKMNPHILTLPHRGVFRLSHNSLSGFVWHFLFNRFNILLY